MRELLRSDAKVPEKTLELNVGAELLTRLRGPMGMSQSYLRGLTQLEESQYGVDFFARLPDTSRVFAFQFKAPKRAQDYPPYTFLLRRDQHEMLYDLSQQYPDAVHYVLPFYVGIGKLEHDVPNLSRDTWLLPASAFDAIALFANQATKTIKCSSGIARFNPSSEMVNLSDFMLTWKNGVHPRPFADWYAQHLSKGKRRDDHKHRRNPHLVRGLRISIVL